MAVLDPTATTVLDLCTESLHECGALGEDQTPTASMLSGAQARLQWMLQQWERKRFLVWQIITIIKQSTGALYYTVGPGGDFNTDTQYPPVLDTYGNPTPATGLAVHNSVRPSTLESAFLRQTVIPAGGGNPSNLPVDYPLEILQSKEDYNRVTLKTLTSFTGGVYYDPAWPLGVAFPVPVPQASLYSLGLTFRMQLPPVLTPATVWTLPYECYAAMLYNLALRLRPRYGLGTWPGDPLPSLAKDALAVLRGNAQIARLTMPGALLRPGIYNIFSDRSY